MKDGFLITIDGSQLADGELSKVSMSTVGSYHIHDGKNYILYDESAASGFEGDTTLVKIEGDRCVTMTRRGATNSQLVLQRDARNLCHYDTGFGDLTVGVRTSEIINRLNESGGLLSLKYSLDVGASTLAENEIKITVREKIKNA